MCRDTSFDTLMNFVRVCCTESVDFVAALLGH